MTVVKICGITQVKQAQDIAQYGVDYLGFIGVPSSPRYRDPQTFAAIVQSLRASLNLPPRSVGVFANGDLAELKSVQNQVLFEVLQLHGQESPEFCDQVKAAFPHCQIWKAFRVRDTDDLQRVTGYETIVDGIVLDAYHPQLLGGTGETIDWSILSQFKPKVPWFLAGGITPNNVSLALQQLSPSGIDVSSGVERSPGDKDLTLVHRLMTHIRGLKENPENPRP
jgi:phosphoribosylanthranilate isomerase